MLASIKRALSPKRPTTGAKYAGMPTPKSGGNVPAPRAEAPTAERARSHVSLADIRAKNYVGGGGPPGERGGFNVGPQSNLSDASRVQFTSFLNRVLAGAPLDDRMRERLQTHWDSWQGGSGASGWGNVPESLFTDSGELNPMFAEIAGKRAGARVQPGKWAPAYKFDWGGGQAPWINAPVTSRASQGIAKRRFGSVPRWTPKE